MVVFFVSLKYIKKQVELFKYFRFIKRLREFEFEFVFEFFFGLERFIFEISH